MRGLNQTSTKQVENRVGMRAEALICHPYPFLDRCLRCELIFLHLGYLLHDLQSRGFFLKIHIFYEIYMVTYCRKLPHPPSLHYKSNPVPNFPVCKTPHAAPPPIRITPVYTEYRQGAQYLIFTMTPNLPPWVIRVQTS